MQRINRKDIPHLKKHAYLRQKSKNHNKKEVFLSLKSGKNEIDRPIKDKAEEQQKQNTSIANVFALKPQTFQLDQSFQNKQNISHRQTDSQSNEPQIPQPIESKSQLEDYLQDIFSYLKNRKKASLINHQYLYEHNLLTYKLRSYFVRHIFKIFNKFNLKRKTLYLSVQYMDLYFSANTCFKDQSEIISVVQACLFMAMKYEEIYPPSLRDWVDRRYINQIINIEANIMKSLNYELTQQTAENYLQFIIQNEKKQLKESAMMEETRFILDLCLFDINMRQFESSKIAENVYFMFNRPESCDENIIKNIKWMIERNKPSLQWLLNNIYKKIEMSNLI